MSKLSGLLPVVVSLCLTLSVAAQARESVPAPSRELTLSLSPAVQVDDDSWLVATGAVVKIEMTTPSERAECGLLMSLPDQFGRFDYPHSVYLQQEFTFGAPMTSQYFIPDFLLGLEVQLQGYGFDIRGRLSLTKDTKVRFGSPDALATAER